MLTAPSDRFHAGGDKLSNQSGLQSGQRRELRKQFVWNIDVLASA